ncbi:cytoplasmic 60S subunit biogenesis factor ZNF622 [Episyrphus balteatus]|uniref:cytoplasmic 60S subunit biogenesis factor ZNF622 n=1 Tax=Episyrphus balteatus TaxID=286459 RepID=UPI002485D38C|nr:cytoplasmic 60S subunit biogenesis factor ZNF622 [Episyrphus balteatus]
MSSSSSSAFTCINCNIKLANAEFHREHYKTDWHRYNLKRRIASLPPVTADEFQNRVLQMRNADTAAIEEKQTSLYCNACRKQFSSQCSHDNHLNSKKHKENLTKFNDINGDSKEITTKSLVQPKQHPMMVEEDESIEEVDSDEWEDVGPNPIADNNCIFCDEHSEDLVDNLKHMSVAHSFFIPDAEFCTDLEGLLFYLGDKVCNHFICLWCNDRGKTFYTLDAVRKHMIDKGHCQMLHEGIALAEYTEFYDYSSSYPDNKDGMDIDEEFVPDLLDGDEYQLVLPSGAVIGHRSLLRYYKQRLNPNRAITINKSDRKLHKVLSQYRSLGWTATEQKAAARKARDIHLMKRVQAKWQMKLGVRANKLQHHFRQQVLF